MLVLKSKLSVDHLWSMQHSYIVQLFLFVGWLVAEFFNSIKNTNCGRSTLEKKYITGINQLLNHCLIQDMVSHE